jgi:hypothetical protein
MQRIDRMLLPPVRRKGKNVRLKYFVLFIAIFTGLGVAYSIHSQTTPTALRPFIVTSVMAGPADNFLKSLPFSRAVRADGSWVETWTRTVNGRTYYERDIHDYENGVYTIVEDATQSVVRSSIPQSEYKHRLAPAVLCQGSSAGKILGINVNYYEDTYQITENPQGDATAVIKTWVAPDLGCFVLQKETIWTRNSDGVKLTDTKIVPIAVSFQDVDSLFQAPITYTERTKQETIDLVNQLTK